LPNLLQISNETCFKSIAKAPSSHLPKLLQINWETCFKSIGKKASNQLEKRLQINWKKASNQLEIQLGNGFNSIAPSTHPYHEITILSLSLNPA
jgi:hypothetical protein